jgi:O-antigen ligase
VGTYTNRNHLAGLIEMVLPLTLALYFFSLGHRRRRTSRGWRGRLVFLSTFRGHTAFVYGVLALLLIVGLVFTRSRTGIALAMLGIVLVTFAFARRIGGENVYGPAGTVVAFAVGLGIAIGLTPVLDRFGSQDPLEDARWSLFSATMEGIVSFFPVGSGPGTFPDVFHAFHPPQHGSRFINHAHNDYLQWLFEGGVVAAILIVLMLGLYFLQWGRVWTKETWSRFRFVQVGAGIGMFLILLHELVDYNLHIPANTVYFAFLAGIFFSDPGQEAASGGRRRRRRRTPVMETATQVSDAAVKPIGPPPDQIKNPFLD